MIIWVGQPRTNPISFVGFCRITRALCSATPRICTVTANRLGTPFRTPLRAFARRNTQQIDSHVAARLFTACRNRLLGVMRGECRQDAGGGDGIDTAEGPGPDPAAMTERADSALYIQRMIAELPVKQREVVRLKFQNRLSYREISRITGISESNIGYLLHVAIRPLRRRGRRKSPVKPAMFNRRHLSDVPVSLILSFSCTSSSRAFP